MFRMHICVIFMIKIWSKEICAINRAPLLIPEGSQRYICKKSVSPRTDRKYLCFNVVFPKYTAELSFAFYAFLCSTI